MLTSARTVRPALLTWAVCTVLFAGTMLLFSRGTEYGFSNYDDPEYVTDNRYVQAGLTWESVVWAFTAPADYWHPLTWLSHMLDWQIYGLAPYGHHLTSVLWHAANAVLVFLIFRRLTGAYWASAFAAALFAWHPLRVESVVWITERKDVMSGFFFLVTVWAYAAYTTRRETSRTAWPQYLLTLLLFVGGLMSKPMLVTLPAVLLVLDFWPLQRVSAATWSWARAWTLLFEKLPLFALSAIASVATLLMQRHKEAFVLDLPLSARIANALVSIVRYMGKVVWPFDLTVCYPHPGHWPVWIVAAATLLILTITVGAWRQRKTRPWILAGWAGYGIMLLPAIGVIQVGFQAMADRYTYLPVLFLQLAVVWTIREWSFSAVAQRWMAAIAVIALGGAALRTWDQQGTWRDPMTMFEHAIAVTDRNEFAHAFLSYTLLTKNRLDEAEVEAQRALALNPHNITALLSHASTLERQRRSAEAIATYRAVLEIDQTHAQASYRLGGLLLRSGHADEALAKMVTAIKRDPTYLGGTLEAATMEALHGQPANALYYYRVVLSVHPDDPDALFGTGMALKALGRPAEARVAFEKLLTTQPDHASAHHELGLILLGADEVNAAAGHFRAAVKAEPKFSIAYVGLGRAAEKLGLIAEATASFEQAIQLDPENAVALRVWAETLARRQRFSEAATVYQRAAAIDPTNAEIRAGLGFTLILSGHRDEGAAAWREALRLNPQFPGIRERLERLESAGR